MADGSKIFSRAALDKLRSPDRLDMLLPITTPIGWMSLVAVGLLLISVILWSIFGSFTVRADGKGMILDSGGVTAVTHVAGGKIAHVYVRKGATISKGDLIAQLEQPQQSADTNMAQYGPQLASSMKDTADRVYQYKAKLYQQGVSRDVISDYDGIVEDVMIRKGSVISSGTPLCSVRLTKKRSDLTGVMYVPVDKGKRIEPGQTIQLVPNGVDVQESGSVFDCRYAVRSSRPEIPAQPFRVTFTVGDRLLAETNGEIPASGAGLLDLGGGGFRIPETCTGNAKIVFELPESGIRNTWELTVLPPAKPVTAEIVTVRSFTEAEPHLQRGEAVLLIPAQITEKIRGFYCTDFWNYPMFRSISESVGRQVPVGTMGLCIDRTHPVAKALFSDDYSTPQWYSIVTHADCAVLDEAPAGFRPKVQMIDNVERNHRLGLLFETAVGGGRLFVCTARLTECPDDLCMNRLHRAIAAYMQSDAFAPAETLSADLLRKLFC